MSALKIYASPLYNCPSTASVTSTYWAARVNLLCQKTLLFIYREYNRPTDKELGFDELKELIQEHNAMVEEAILLASGGTLYSTPLNALSKKALDTNGYQLAHLQEYYFDYSESLFSDTWELEGAPEPEQWQHEHLQEMFEANS